MSVAQASGARSDANKSPLKRAPALAVLSLAAILTGCSSASDLDVFGIFDESAPPTTTAGQANVRERADAESEAAKEQPTPKLSSVPERPVAPTPLEVRQNVVQGLVADRENARYSDQVIRHQGSSRKTFVTQKTEAPAPAPEVETASPAPATPPPPVETAKATPPPEPAQINWNSERVPPRPAPAPPPTTAVSTPPPPPPSVSAPATDPAGVRVDLAALESGADTSATETVAKANEQVATIHFADSSSALSDRDKQIIAEVASAQRQSNADILVVGHASSRTEKQDKVEHELSNFRMSLARANRVASQLIAMGVDPKKVQVEAVADDNPLYSETEPAGEAGNRRADIYFRQ